MATYTSKLNLKKPAQNDFYNIDDFNGNADKIDEFASRTDNPHSVTKAQVGLGNVDNTSDNNKPVSTAQATAIADAKQAGTNAQASLNNHINNKSNPHNTTADLVRASKMFTYGEANTYTTVLDACNALKYGGGFVASSFSPMVNASDYPQKGYEFVFNVVCEANEARKVVIAYMYHGGKMNIFQRNIFNGAWETAWNSIDESYYGEHNLPNAAQVFSGTYKGNGNSGSAYANKLPALNFTPKIVIIEGWASDVSHNYKCILYNGNTVGVVYTFKGASGYEFNNVNVTWTNNSVQWYVEGSNTAARATSQLNSASVTYNYIAIG